MRKILNHQYSHSTSKKTKTVRLRFSRHLSEAPLGFRLSAASSNLLIIKIQITRGFAIVPQAMCRPIFKF